MTGLIQDIIGGRSSELANEDHFRIVASCSRVEPRSFVFGSCLATGLRMVSMRRLDQRFVMKLTINGNGDTLI